MRFTDILLLLPGVLTLKDWYANIPKQLSAISGNCVVIPCEFHHPGHPKQNPIISLIWYQVSNDGKAKDQIIFHSENPVYQKRATLVGDIQIKNCSVWIRDITINDAKTYRLQVEVKGFQNYSYPSTVNLHVEDTPTIPNLRDTTWDTIDGNEVTLTCKTNHTCNLSPPELKWNNNLANPKHEQMYMGDGIWQVVSKQTFIASRHLQGQQITCQATYKKKEISSSPGSLNILYPPGNTSIKVTEESIREGQNISFFCSSQSNPEVTQYDWYGVEEDGKTVILKGNHSRLNITNIKRNLLSYYCSAKNYLGSEKSPVFRINMLRKPEIISGSYCRAKLGRVECRCLVDSYPPALIIWHVLDRNITESGEGFDMSIISTNHVTESILTGVTPSMGNVLCYSANEEGGVQAVLVHYSDIAMLLLIIGVCLLVLGIGLTLSLRALIHRRNEKNTPNVIANYYGEATNECIINKVYVSQVDDVYANVIKNPQCLQKGSSEPNKVVCSEESFEHEESIYQNF